MTEDDEVDILGDFTFSCSKGAPDHQPLSSYSELLQCDYSVHPQWLLDTATPSCWYDASLNDEIKLDGTVHPDPEFNRPEGESSGNEKASNEWTKSERDLLHRGLETYGQDLKRLSKFVGTKTTTEIQAFIEAECGISLDTLDDGFRANVREQTLESADYGEILTENEIPASMEEVICMVSTAETTTTDLEEIPSSPKKASPSPKKTSNRSLLKISQRDADVFSDVPSFDDSHRVDKRRPHLGDRVNIEISSAIRERKMKKEIETDKEKRYSDDEIVNHPMAIDAVSPKKTKFNISLTISKSNDLGSFLNKKKKKRTLSSHRRKSEKDKKKQIPRKIKMEIVTGSGKILPLSEGEQVVKVTKSVDEDEEVEIDIDSDVEQSLQIDLSPNKRSRDTEPTEIKLEDSKNMDILDIKVEPDLKTSLSDLEEFSDVPFIIPESIKSLVLSMDTPMKEVFIDPTVISDLERFLYPEFFEGRPSKTPMRYSLIRSHLIMSWQQNKPQYLTKTAARQGLKNCGDVNCIGRIHTILEQMGAINFGCEQTQYIRPLATLRLKSEATSSMGIAESKLKREELLKLDITRQRKKKIVLDGEGGYTITHSEYGEILEAVSEPKPQRTVRKKPVSLLYCKNFSEDNPAPYSVQIALSALILMDFHAHTSRAEVMGLLGGHFLPSSNLLTIEKYVPCDSLEDSGTHCDMCPVSQSIASESLSMHGLETVGWHHSHPLFPPQPSAQDILSQADLQNAFSPHPFLAIILSPYWPPGRTSSQYCCLLVKEGHDVQNIAYKFKTNVHCDIVHQKDVTGLLQQVQDIWDRMQNTSGTFALNMRNDVCSNANISYLEKCISSIGHHLNLCRNNINTVRITGILEGINRIVR